MRPTIYIGLGGTGIRAISQTKKLYEDSYGVGQIPAHIAFLVMDFDSWSIDNPTLPTPMRYDAIYINSSGNLRAHYESHARNGAYRWMFEGNAGRFLQPSTIGTGQERAKGRFFTEYAINSIESALARCWHRVRQTTYTEEVDVCIVTSLVGGTGAGSFINIAEMVQRNYGKRAHIIGYGVLHGVFHPMDRTGFHIPRIRMNAYASILDLDYLMSASSENPIKFEINGAVRELRGRLFDEFFVVDNVTEEINIIPDVGTLCEILGNCLFVSNLNSDIIAGFCRPWRRQNNLFDILDKRGWAQALGGCQVVYKGDLLAELYGAKAAIEIIRKMRSEGRGAEEMAMCWMDEMRIRENEGYDLLIDSIYSPEKMSRLKSPKIVVEDTFDNIKTETYRYMNTLVEFPTETDIETLKNSKVDALADKLNAIMLTEWGVGNARKFLSTLNSYLQIFKRKMEQEVEELIYKHSQVMQAVEVAFREYDDCTHRIFKPRSGMEERLNKISSSAKTALQLSLEIKRREVARGIFTALIAKVIDYDKQVETIDQVLEHLSREYSENAAKKARKNSSAFEYDLSYKVRSNLPFNPDDIGLGGFMATLSKPLLDMDVHYELKPAIDGYVAQLPGAVAYREVCITDVIEELPDDEYENIIKFISGCSSRLLRINDRGMVSTDLIGPSQMMTNHLFLSIYRKNEHDNHKRIKQLLEGLRSLERECCVDCTYSSLESLKQKIIIYRENCSVISYCIAGFDDMVVDEYERNIKEATGFNPHFDKQLFDKMQQIGFSLKPNWTED